MSKTETSQPVKQDPKTSVPLVKGKGSLMFFPAKGLGSYHAFGPTEDKSRKLFRSAVLQYGSLVGLPNADQALASVLPKSFAEEASGHGWTLKEAMQEAQAYYATHAPEGKPQREKVDPDARMLAGLLAGLAPNDAPSALLKQLRGLIEEKGETALVYLERLEREAGRDSDGYIYLRRVSASTESR
mgnify:CR=1 FL=1